MCGDDNIQFAFNDQNITSRLFFAPERDFVIKQALNLLMNGREIYVCMCARFILAWASGWLEYQSWGWCLSHSNINDNTCHFLWARSTHREHKKLFFFCGFPVWHIIHTRVARFSRKDLKIRTYSEIFRVVVVNSSTFFSHIFKVTLRIALWSHFKNEWSTKLVIVLLILN